MVSMTLAASEGTMNPVAVELAPAITTLIVFGLVCFVLFTKVWPKIANGLDERQAKIRQEIEAAEAAQAEARAAMEAQQAELAKARAEANEMIMKAKADAEATAKELRERAHAELTELREQAGHQIQEAKESAITELHAETAMLATAIATRILQREINVDDQQSLIDDSLRELESVQGG